MGKDRPLIGISVGDPAGIGPETTAKAIGRKVICPERARKLMGMKGKEG